MDKAIVEVEGEVLEHLSDGVAQLVVLGDQMERLCTLLERIDSSLYVIGSVR